MNWPIMWGIQTDGSGQLVRAFVRVLGAHERVIVERVAAFRVMSPSERLFMASSLRDDEREYALARPFFPDPEQLEGVGGPVAAWLDR